LCTNAARDAYLTRKMSWAEAAALSPEDKLERKRARWRVKAQGQYATPKGKADMAARRTRRRRQEREALKVVVALWGEGWRERLSELAPAVAA
jgi:hypothetical protein